MSRRTKKIFKNLGLGILGLGVLGGAVALCTNYVKNDSVKIHPTYEVGGLTDYGKYVEDEGKLYTKDMFPCDGLKATLDFDNDISYRVFYYDILGNFIEATDDLVEGFSEEAPLNGAYARIEITPLDDEDDKISFREKIDYSSQLNLSVSKTADNINDMFVSFKGKPFEIVNNVPDLVFEYGFKIDENINFVEYDSFTSTTKTLLNVSGYEGISVDLSSMEIDGACAVDLFFISDLENAKYQYVNSTIDEALTFNFDEHLKGTKYILI